MVVTEALAHGLPVVASAVGGVPEALGHGDDGSTPGLLVRPDDPAALAGALRRWLEDPRRRRRLRRVGRAAAADPADLVADHRAGGRGAGGGAMSEPGVGTGAAVAGRACRDLRSQGWEPTCRRLDQPRRGGRLCRSASACWSSWSGSSAPGRSSTGCGRPARGRSLVALVVTAGTTWCCAVRWSLVSARVGRAGAGADGVRRLLPLAADQRDAARRRGRRRAPRASGTAGAAWSGSAVSARWCRWPWSGLLLLPGAVALGRAAAVLARRLVAGGAVLLLSALAVAGHLRGLPGRRGVGRRRRSTPLQLLPIGALVLLGAAIPLNVAGWGPREGVAAWAFAAVRVDGRGRADRRGDLRRAGDWSRRCPGCSSSGGRRDA